MSLTQPVLKERNTNSVKMSQDFNIVDDNIQIFDKGSPKTLPN
jgi:hypothetical protein